MQAVLDYVQGQKTTGFLIVQNRKILADMALNDPTAFSTLIIQAKEHGEQAKAPSNA